jgi:transposase
MNNRSNLVAINRREGIQTLYLNGAISPIVSLGTYAFRFLIGGIRPLIIEYLNNYKHTGSLSLHKNNHMAKIVNPNAAGIDISSKDHYVAVPEDKSEEVRRFGAFTEDLHSLALWLKQCMVETVAMESTGVYWFHLYTVLLDYGFEVFLVNSYHFRSVPRRKSDVSDARWLQELHSLGVLRSSFQPDNLTRSLRNYARHRKMLVKEMSRATQHMQKALEQMNIKLNNVIREVTGKTGMAIIAKIIEGERNPNVLVQYRDSRIKASKEELLKSLNGNWREEQLFDLKMAYEKYLFLQNQLGKCDLESEKTIAMMADENIPEKEIKQLDSKRNQPKFNVRKHLYQALGVDVTQIYGLKQTTALTVFSETGSNLKEKFPTSKQFLSWLNVVPDNKISGGKVIISKVKKKKNNAGQAFREAANSLWNAKNPFGDYLRRKKAKSGSGQAIVATARKLAAVYYKMVTDKVEFDPYIIDGGKQKFLERKMKYLERMIINTKSQLSVYENIT